MPLIDRKDAFLAVIDLQPGFYRDRPDVDAGEFRAFVERASWIHGVACALAIPTLITVERPERNGPAAHSVTDVQRAPAMVFEKRAFDLAADAAIRAVIESYGRRTAILVGMETDVCVVHSAIGLRDSGFRVVGVADALYSPGAAHVHGLERLRFAAVELVSAKELFYDLLPTVDDVRDFKARMPDLARPPGFHP